MNQPSDEMLFTAGHGFYHFALSRDIFDRSLYYNLLLQPKIAIPDHYLLHGSWFSDHLRSYRDRDSWLEIGLRNGFVQPYFRNEAHTLAQSLDMMRRADRRGFDKTAEALASRLDRSVTGRGHWSAPTNSERFRDSMVSHLCAKNPPLLELDVDPDDYDGFWQRSRSWMRDELDVASERSTTLIGSDGLLLSQLMQVTGERMLGERAGRIESVGSLLRRVRRECGATAANDVHAYYTFACELYNRSLADTISTASGSPRWSSYAAAVDLESDATQADISSAALAPFQDFETSIELPTISSLRRVTGDTLLAIRRTEASKRYVEALQQWRTDPQSPDARAELVTTLERYSVEIRKAVGKDVATFGLHPQFISATSDVSRVIEKVPNVIHGFLAWSGPSTAAYVAADGDMSPWVPAALFTMFCLQTVAKRLPTRAVGLEVTARDGLRLYPDVTVSRT